MESPQRSERASTDPTRTFARSTAPRSLPRTAALTVSSIAPTAEIARLHYFQPCFIHPRTYNFQTVRSITCQPARFFPVAGDFFHLAGDFRELVGGFFQTARCFFHLVGGFHELVSHSNRVTVCNFRLVDGSNH